MSVFGMPTLIELPDIEACAKLCRETGLQFVELNMCLPQYQTERLDFRQLSRLMEQYDIYYTFHLDENCSPCDFNQRVAAAHTETVVDTINIAKRLGAPVLNMHLSLGTSFTMPNEKIYLFERYRTEYRKNLKLFRDRCEEAVGGADIKLCVENTRAFDRLLGKESLALLLESPVFAITYDTGHDAGGGFTQRAVIDEHLDRLRHIHLHDALPGERRDHMVLGEGELNIADYLRLADSYSCRVVIEVKTVAGLKKSVQYIEKIKKPY